MKPKALVLLIFLVVSSLPAAGHGAEVGDPFTAFIGPTHARPSLRVEELSSLRGWWLYRISGVPFDLPIRPNVNSAFQIEMGGGVVHFSDRNRRVRLKFTIDNGQVTLTEALGRPAQLVHVSKGLRHEVVSILWKDLPSGNLVALYLSPHLDFPEAAPRRPKFSFLFPLGARWRADQVELNICGFRQSELKAAARRGIAQWQAVLQGKLNIKVDVIDRAFPPFADLNTKCIYWIDNYRPAEASRRGTSLLLPSADAKSMVDGDIFIFSSELSSTKFPTEEELARAVEILVTHEVGHWLGLDHPVDRRTPSVMNYQDRLDLTAYDIEAIHSLYP